MRILFVTWDGPQVQYVESLFLPIFAGLRAEGYEFDILQFRWGSPEQEQAVRSACAAAGCGYASVRIWRWGGLGAFATALRGALSVRKAVRRFGADAIMPRSILPSLAVLAAGGPSLRPVLLDADGIEADERVEFAGLSPTGLVYRVMRDIEAQMVRKAATVLVRSAAAREILMARAGPPADPAKYTIVANGRDESAFQPFDPKTRLAVREELGIDPAAPLAVYAGSVGPQYRFDLIRGFAEAVARRRPDARLLILSGSPDRAEAELAGAPLRPVFMRAAPERVGRYIAAADIGLAYRAQSFSMQAVAPVKLGEYLLCGVPAVGNANVGDTRGPSAAGVFLDDSEGPEAAARWLIEAVLPRREEYRDRARAAGVESFSLRRSVADYLAAIAPPRG
jgi:glycosyltransferase involved in cell wall biosynthesis